MIRTENVSIRGNVYERTWSDLSVMIERDGVLYEEAVNPVGSGRVYTEAIDHPIEETELTAEEALDILLGGDGA